MSFPGIRALFVKPLVTWFLFTLLGTADWVIALVRSRDTSILGAFYGWALFWGLWTLLGFASIVLIGSLWWAALDAGSDVRQYLLNAPGRIWTERRGDADIDRLAGLAAGLGTVVAWCASGVIFVRYLILHRHGATLIALTAVAGLALFFVGAFWLFLTLRRFLRFVIRQYRKVPALRWLNTPVLIGFFVLGAVGCIIAALASFWDVFIAVDGPALALLAAALMAQLTVTALVERRTWRPLAALFAQLFLGFISVAVAAQSSEARRLVLYNGQTARYIYHVLYTSLDVDGDGAPGFPLGEDCAPFNRDIGPYAAEIEGDGIDQNCDGSDRAFSIKPRRSGRFKRPPGPAPNLVLVTLDATRADHTSFMGYGRKTTPNLDLIAASSAVFKRAFSQDSGTGPSCWSLFSGKTPFQVRLGDRDIFPPIIDPSERMLGDELKRGGYAAEAVLCGDMFDAPHWLISRGFQRFKNVCGLSVREMAPLTVRLAREALGRLSGAQPFFLWLHVLDPHHPYFKHLDHPFGDRPADLYDEEIYYTDRQLGGFLNDVKNIARQRPLYLVVAADHGEAFGEHGPDIHARTLYREVTNVPLFVNGPGIAPRRIDAPVALGDLYPTLLDLAGLHIPAQTTMVSQAPVLFGAKPDESRIVFQENSYSRPRRHVRAAVYGRYQYLMDLTTKYDEMYDYVDDPLERRNLIGVGLPEEALLRRALVQFLQTSRIPRWMRD